LPTCRRRVYLWLDGGAKLVLVRSCPRSIPASSTALEHQFSASVLDHPGTPRAVPGWSLDLAKSSNSAYCGNTYDASTQAVSSTDGLQDRICRRPGGGGRGGAFVEDDWERRRGAAGRSRVMAEGRFFEQAGVSSPMSTVRRSRARPPPAADLAIRLHRPGVSIVLHPQNPYVPTTHTERPLLRRPKSTARPGLVFGAGSTSPVLPLRGGCRPLAHRGARPLPTLRRGRLPAFKRWCDKYFYCATAASARRGGLFFDDLSEWVSSAASPSSARWATASSRLSADRRAPPGYSVRRGERDFQLYRRGRSSNSTSSTTRTLFGLQSGGRTESILMSLRRRSVSAKLAAAAGEPEARSTRVFLQPARMDSRGGRLSPK